ncbi:MAG: hypothetical protein M1818_002917 [Claussenomyces sp. TS43310]|nr:MAG: hypothetical protein M1818_002917 [Claussenomyces sp. TS43310]
MASMIEPLQLTSKARSEGSSSPVLSQAGDPPDVLAGEDLHGSQGAFCTQVPCGSTHTAIPLTRPNIVHGSVSADAALKALIDGHQQRKALCPSSIHFRQSSDASTIPQAAHRQDANPKPSIVITPTVSTHNDLVPDAASTVHAVSSTRSRNRSAMNTLPIPLSMTPFTSSNDENIHRNKAAMEAEFPSKDHLSPCKSGSPSGSEKENSQGNRMLPSDVIAKAQKQSSVTRPTVAESCTEREMFKMDIQNIWEGFTRVPRNYVRIPSDQLELLDRSESWFSATAGSTFPPVNIPGKVLIDLQTFRAHKVSATTKEALRDNRFPKPKGDIDYDTDVGVSVVGEKTVHEVGRFRKDVEQIVLPDVRGSPPDNLSSRGKAATEHIAESTHSSFEEAEKNIEHTRPSPLEKTRPTHNSETLDVISDTESWSVSEEENTTKQRALVPASDASPVSSFAQRWEEHDLNSLRGSPTPSSNGDCAGRDLSSAPQKLQHRNSVNTASLPFSSPDADKEMDFAIPHTLDDLVEHGDALMSDLSPGISSVPQHSQSPMQIERMPNFSSLLPSPSRNPQLVSQLDEQASGTLLTSSLSSSNSIIPTISYVRTADTQTNSMSFSLGMPIDHHNVGHSKVHQAPSNSLVAREDHVVACTENEDAELVQQWIHAELGANSQQCCSETSTENLASASCTLECSERRRRTPMLTSAPSREHGIIWPSPVLPCPSQESNCASSPTSQVPQSQPATDGKLIQLVDIKSSDLKRLPDQEAAFPPSNKKRRANVKPTAFIFREERPGDAKEIIRMNRLGFLKGTSSQTKPSDTGLIPSRTSAAIPVSGVLSETLQGISTGSSRSLDSGSTHLSPDAESALIAPTSPRLSSQSPLPRGTDSCIDDTCCGKNANVSEYALHPSGDPTVLDHGGLIQRRRVRSPTSRDNELDSLIPNSLVETASEQEEPITKNVWESYRLAYPLYGESLTSFVKSCVYITWLVQIKNAPHPYLWDDFVRAFSTEYPMYVRRSRDLNQRPVPGVQYYNTYVSSPIFKKGVITPSTLSEALALNSERTATAWRSFLGNSESNSQHISLAPSRKSNVIGVSKADQECPAVPFEKSQPLQHDSTRHADAKTSHQDATYSKRRSDSQVVLSPGPYQEIGLNGPFLKTPGQLDGVVLEQTGVGSLLRIVDDGRSREISEGISSAEGAHGRSSSIETLHDHMPSMGQSLSQSSPHLVSSLHKSKSPRPNQKIRERVFAHGASHPSRSSPLGDLSLTETTLAVIDHEILTPSKLPCPPQELNPQVTTPSLAMTSRSRMICTGERDLGRTSCGGGASPESSSMRPKALQPASFSSALSWRDYARAHVNSRKRFGRMSASATSLKCTSSSSEKMGQNTLEP